MSSKRAVSPGPVDLMKDILKLIAEPSSTSSRRRAEVPVQPPAKVNHDYCDECKGGGEIVCCDSCPKSYHINCHIPTIIKLPDGEWFCRSCTSNGNAESTPEVPIDISQFPNENAYIMASLSKYFPKNGSYNPPLIRIESDIILLRKYNAKLPARKQLDKQKMVRKIDKCCLCKRGFLRGRLIQCHYCSRLYHLNCLDPPIRDWDHSMRWLCPAHNKFYEVAYPTIFPPSNKILTDSYTIKRQRCELPSLPVNTSFNIPSHIDAMYKKPEENIPATSINKSSLNMLCDVASRELESINSNNKINRCVEHISYDRSAKFLAHSSPEKLKKNNYLLPKQPTASLSCLSQPINISIKKKSLTIGKNPNNNLCLLTYGNCEFTSGFHATITYDDKLGDYLVKNHSRHGIIVDNVSYFGNHRPKDLSNCSEQKKINSLVIKHINKRRRSVRKHEMFRVYQNIDEKYVLKYVNKRKRFDYGQMSKYDLNKIKNNNYLNKHAYRRTQCLCSKRFIPKDGYPGVAVLRNESIMSIGCMKFKFTYDTYTREIPKECNKTKQEQTMKNKQPLNGTRLKSQSDQEICINKVNGIRNKPELVTTNGHCSLNDKCDTNSSNEQKNISTISLDIPGEPGILNCKTKINGLVDIKSSQVNNNKQYIDTSLSISPQIPCTNNNNKQWNKRNGISSKIQTCFANDLIQEVEVNVSSEDGDTIEEVVYCSETDNSVVEDNGAVEDNGVVEDNGTVEENGTVEDNSTVECSNDVQDWIIEEIVEDEVGNCNGNEHSVDNVDLQSTSTVQNPVPNGNHGVFKTEHLYCARSPSYNETIVISDDDDE